MDTLTHGLSAALLARATSGRPGPGALPTRTRMGVAFLAALFPDSDIIVALFNRQEYLLVHRGITHSLVMLPVWSLLLSLLLAQLYRRRYSWRALWPVVALGMGTHIVEDLFTAFGTMIFAPLSDVRVSIPTTFIVDPYFSGILILGLIASAIFRRSAVPAMLALAILVGYVGFQEALRERARNWGLEYAVNHGWTPAVVVALPQPLSPFNWLVIVDRVSDYHVAYVNLNRTAPAVAGKGFFARLCSAYAPRKQAQWTQIEPFTGDAVTRDFEQRAWNAPVLAGYRAFSMFPIAHLQGGDPRGRCVVFNDLRFSLPAMPARGLGYEICRRAGQWWIPSRR